MAKLMDSQVGIIADRANKIMQREQDRCGFEHFVRLAVSELVSEGAIPTDRSALNSQVPHD